MTALAVIAAVGGSWLASSALAIFVATAIGSVAPIPAVVRLGDAFLAVTVPVTAIWVAGAVQTRAACRRVAGLTDADRSAIAELHRLLEAC